MPAWAGPYRVTARKEPVNYELTNVATGRKMAQTPHVSRLKRYWGTMRPTDMPTHLPDDDAFDASREEADALVSLREEQAPAAPFLVTDPDIGAEQVPLDLTVAGRIGAVSPSERLYDVFARLHALYEKTFGPTPRPGKTKPVEDGTETRRLVRRAAQDPEAGQRLRIRDAGTQRSGREGGHKPRGAAWPTKMPPRAKRLWSTVQDQY